jgi:hypothetical protein
MIKLAGEAFKAIFRWFLCYLVIVIAGIIPLLILSALLAALGFHLDNWSPWLLPLLSFIAILATTMLSIRLTPSPGDDARMFGRPRWPKSS